MLAGEHKPLTDDFRRVAVLISLLKNTPCVHSVMRFGGFCLCCVFLPLAHIKGKLHYSGAIFTSLIYKQYHHVEMGKSNSVNKLDLGKIDELNLRLFLEGRLCFIFLTFPRPYTLNLYGFAQV